MKKFEPILDAYELAEGSIVKGKDQDELFQLGAYDADKKGYDAYSYQDGVRFDDFMVVITESELMDNYLVSKRDDEEEAEGGMLSDNV